MRKEQEKKAGLEQALIDFIKSYETFRERIINSTVSHMLCLEQSTTLYFCIDDRENIKWCKTESEMNTKRNMSYMKRLQNTHNCGQKPTEMQVHVSTRVHVCITGWTT
ncbi:MAG: hypothetical protein WAM14_23040 [Candidatus Nitrosopolaris sp.]